ncbi:hypothetical protein FRC06_003978 [Ceratobasidium sp. 370]|nr:hypothetical protein FRC06_003978 [Ceratobasidium sp. 370]
MPLNDFAEPPSPPYLPDNMQLPSPDWSPTLDPLPNRYPTCSQKISSPLFISDIRPASPRLLSPISSTLPFSSDDTTIPAPSRNSIYSPERDEIQGALSTRHSFVASVYATSPTLGGLPLNTLVGSYSSSRAQTSSPLLGPTWSNSPRFSTHTLPARPRPDSADVYKARLLAYATAAAEQLSSTSGDEALAYRRWGGVGPNTGTTGGVTHEAASDGSVGGLFTEDTAGELTLESRPQSASQVDNSPVYQPQGASHTSEPISKTSSEADNQDLPNSDDFDQIDVELFEDWRGEPTEDDFEEGGIPASGMQAEEDDLAADEIPEVDVNEIPAPFPEGPTIALAQVKMEPGATATATGKRNLPIAPFPESVSRHTSDHHDASARPEMMAKLSPKFVAQPARRIRPSPFAHLLKNRRDQVSSVELTTRGGPEDDIESWPA